MYPYAWVLRRRLTSATKAALRGEYWVRLSRALRPSDFASALRVQDPGNWATDLQGGAQYGYTLLVVVLLSNLLAIFLQSLSLRLGVVSERDLAQACRDAYPRVRPSSLPPNPNPKVWRALL